MKKLFGLLGLLAAVAAVLAALAAVLCDSAGSEYVTIYRDDADSAGED